MEVYRKRTKLSSMVALLLIAAGAWAAPAVQQDWRGRERETVVPPGTTVAVPAASVSLSSITVTDASDGSRSSTSSLTMVLSSGTTRSFKATANPSGANGSWYVDGKAVSTGTSLTYSAGLGTHKVECRSSIKSASASVEVISQAKQTVQLDVTPVKKLADVFSQINRLLGQPDSTIAWTLAGLNSSWNVDKKGTARSDISRNWSFSGGANLNYKAYSPVYSVTPSYLKARVWVQPALSLPIIMSADKDASTNPYTWRFSGGPALSGSITAGLDLSAGDPRVIKFDGDVRGTALASGTGKLQGPPASANLAYNIGKLTVGGPVRVWLVGQPVVTYTVSYTIWNGLSGQTVVSLASLIN